MPRLQGDAVVEAWGTFELEPDRGLVLAEDLAKYVCMKAARVHQPPFEGKRKTTDIAPRFYVGSLQVPRDSISIVLEERRLIARTCLDRLDNLRNTGLDRFQPAVGYVQNHMDAFFDPNTNYALAPCTET